MSRTGIREHIFKIIYNIEIQSLGNSIENIEEIITLYFESNEIINEEIMKEIKDMILNIYNENSNLISVIEKYLKDGWKIERVSKINIAILKLSIYELKNTEIPFKVSLNEAIKIAKRYGDEQSAKYINGILASIVKEDKQE